MNTNLTNISSRKAALIVGIAFITSVFIVFIVDDLILPNFVVPGDTDTLAKDIATNKPLLGFAAVGYLIVLLLDSIIGLAIFVVLKRQAMHWQ